MSAIIAVVSRQPRFEREEVVERALRSTNGECAFSRLTSCGDATLGAAASEWAAMREDDIAIAVEGDVVVVADATLFYRGALIRALSRSGVRCAARTPAQLILAAYRLWGDECPRHLEGDFAFVVWDGARRRICAGRDLGATRPLVYSITRDTLLIGSSIDGLLAAGADDGLDLAHVGEVAAGLALDEGSTCRRAIRRVPAAHTLTWSSYSELGLARHWVPPRFETGREMRLEEGAEVLRDLLTDAVRERLDPSRPTSVWLSGGWDSPAVFGAAMLATHGDVDRIRAVSITYPVGDPGREDELIASIAGRWGATPHWVDSSDIRLLDDPRAGAAARSEPFAHVFEYWNRALARGSRATGTHVALHGNGGDQLFQVSLIYLADLLRQGRIREVARECRARGVRDVRTLFRWAVQPLLPSFAHRGTTILRRGRPLRHYLEREVPSWIDGSFAERHGLRSRAARVIERENGESFSSVESRHYLTHPYFPRVYACVSELARDEGVEVRSPLLDARVIAFASERPREERASHAETKRALRAAMRGIIPDEVLAPRRARTGTTGRLFARALRDGGGELLDEVTRGSRLADLGLVDPKKLREGWRQWLATWDGNLGVALFLTVQTEFWLRAEEARAGARRSPPGALTAVAS